MILIKSHYEDLVCTNPNWLCGTVIGTLLSIEFVARARVTGCYSIEDFQSAFPEADSLNILHVLEALQLCTQVDIIFYKEYPLYIYTTLVLFKIIILGCYSRFFIW